VALQRRGNQNAATATSNAASAPSTVCGDGESRDVIAGRVFELLEQGVSLPQIVCQLSVRPDVVRALSEQYRELKALDLTSDSVPRLLAEITDRLGALEADVSELHDGAALTPLWRLGAAHRCGSCGHGGGMAIEVVCTHCRGSALWGPWR